MIYQLINEVVRISREFPVVYDIFCVLVIFTISSAYNSFKRLRINLVGIFLSSTLSYSLLYLVWKIKPFNLDFNPDMKLIVCILTGFISIEFFTRFNPAVIVSFILEFLANSALAQLERYDRGKYNSVANGKKEGANDGNEKTMSELPKENLSDNKEDSREDKTFSGFQRTK